MTYPVIVMPDAVYVVGYFLAAELPGYGWDVPVRDRVPTTRPATFVVVRRVGGVERNIVTDEAMITVEAWAPTHQQAADLCAVARALVHSMPGVQTGATVYKVQDVAGPSLLPDDLSANPRYTCTLTVAMRGTVTAAASV